jgi:hypothetical protein
MSPTEQKNDAQTIAVGLLPLLKEYTKKLRKLSAQGRQIQAIFADPVGSTVGPGPAAAVRFRHDFQRLHNGFYRLLTPATDLARQVSQLVAHGRVETVTLLELSLRLAEFENALREAQEIVNAGPEVHPR